MKLLYIMINNTPNKFIGWNPFKEVYIIYSYVARDGKLIIFCPGRPEDGGDIGGAGWIGMEAISSCK